MANPYQQQVSDLTSGFGIIAKNLLNLEKQDYNTRLQTLTALKEIDPTINAGQLASNPSQLQSWVNPNALQLFDPSNLLDISRRGGDISENFNKYISAYKKLPDTILGNYTNLRNLSLTASPQEETGYLEQVQVKNPKQILKSAEQLAAEKNSQNTFQNISFITPSNTNRSLISSTPQAGYIKGYDTNNNYSEVYVPKGVYVPGISATPKQGMTASNLGTTVSGVNVPGATGGADLASSMVAGGSAMQNLISQLNVPQTETEKTQQQILNQMSSLTGQFAQKSADQLAAEQTAGIPELQKQLSNINGQIATKTAEYNALQVANQNKPITMNSIIGNERAILNAKASDIGLLTAQAQALQGNLTVAQDTVNRAIDLKYDTTTNQLAVYQAQLNAIQPILTKEEKTQAQAQQILITQYENTLKDSKTNEQNIQKLVLDYISDMSSAGKTPNQSVISQIQGSKDYNTALGIYGKNAPVKTSSSTSTKEDKEIQSFREDAAKLVGELDTKKTTWGSAYDQLRIKYPKATPDTINSMLGGGIPYNPTTGTFDTSKAWGRAK